MSPGISTRLLATQSDERLLGLVREGHERAFEALVHRYRRPLLGYCRRLPLPDARAEDVVQLALLKAWMAVREGAEVRDLKAWLYRVVHNTAVNAARDSAREREPRADLACLPATAPELDLGLRVREALAEVAALPPLQREVLVRTAVAGHSHERVADDLGLSDGAVRGLLYRARTTLRRAVAALTPPQLLAWVAGRANQGAPATPAPERLAELAGGGGTVGLGGLLLKGGVVAVTAGVLGGAALVHLNSSPRHHARHPVPAAAPAHGGTVASVSPAPAGLVPPRGESALASHPRRVPARRGRSSGREVSQRSGGGGLGTGRRHSSNGFQRSPARAPGGARKVPLRGGTQGTTPPTGAGSGSPSGSSARVQLPPGAGAPARPRPNRSARPRARVPRARAAALRRRGAPGKAQGRPLAGPPARAPVARKARVRGAQAPRAPLAAPAPQVAPLAVPARRAAGRGAGTVR